MPFPQLLARASRYQAVLFGAKGAILLLVSTNSDLIVRRIVQELFDSLADDEERIMSRQEELRLVALVRALSLRDSVPKELAVDVIPLYYHRFPQRSWYHRVAGAVVLDLALGQHPGIWFYGNWWVESSSLREWMLDVAWAMRERLNPMQAIPHLLRSLERSHFGDWDMLLRWLLEQHGQSAWDELHAFVPEAHPDRYPESLQRFLIPDSAISAQTASFQKTEQEAQGLLATG